MTFNTTWAINAFTNDAPSLCLKPDMARLFRRQEAGINEQTLLRLSTELSLNYSTTAGTGYQFIHKQEVRRILQHKDIRKLLGSLAWYRDEHASLIWPHMSRILCILITIPSTDWNHFMEYFFKRTGKVLQPIFIDDDLPVDDTSFKANTPADFKSRFLNQQWTFVPMEIYEHKYEEYRANHRLPFTERERIGRGGQGKVHKVTVEKRFLISMGDRPNMQASHRMIYRGRHR